MRHLPSLFSAAALTGLLALSGGCTQYYTLEDACDDKVPGGGFLGPLESESFLRINCHRRLSGLVQARPDRQVQEQADDVINYVLQNPDRDKVFNAAATADYLNQTFGAPGFTGANIFERLDETGYTFVNLRGTGIWELLIFTLDSPSLNDDVFGTPALTGAQAVDELMRDADFRQVALQPSWVHGAWAEAELPSQWWEAAGWNDVINFALQDGDVPIPAPTGRVYYLVSIYDAPHLEKVDKPWTYPKQDQTQVPLYTWSVETRQEFADPRTGFPSVRQLSYPITVHAGSIDSTGYQASAQNPYTLEITAASIVGPEGPRETQIVHPGEQALEYWPDGVFLRHLAGLYTPDPFEAATTYSLFADVSTIDGDFRVDFSFTTAPDDPGVRIDQAPPGTTAATSQALRLAPHLTWPGLAPRAVNHHGSQHTPTLP